MLDWLIAIVVLLQLVNGWCLSVEYGGLMCPRSIRVLSREEEPLEYWIHMAGWLALLAALMLIAWLTGRTPFVPQDVWR